MVCVISLRYYPLWPSVFTYLDAAYSSGLQIFQPQNSGLQNGKVEQVQFLVFSVHKTCPTNSFSLI